MNEETKASRHLLEGGARRREIYEKAASYLENLAEERCSHWYHFFGCGICKGAKLLRKILS